jgi:hypothetical protein
MFELSVIPTDDIEHVKVFDAMNPTESTRSLDKLLDDMTKAIPSKEEFEAMQQKGMMVEP